MERSTKVPIAVALRVVVRFEWLPANPDAPRWQRSFSSGQSCKLNGVMNLESSARRTERARRSASPTEGIGMRNSGADKKRSRVE